MTDEVVVWNHQDICINYPDFGGREHELPIIMVSCFEELYCTGKQHIYSSCYALLTLSFRRLPISDAS